MNAIEPDLIEEADLQAPAKRRMPKAVRTGLIAACLCLALLGTATAAVQFFNIRIVDGNDGFTRLYGGISYYPYDSLSDEIKEIEDYYTINEDNFTLKSFNFSSWQEVENFIGLDLVNNPVLDASPAKEYCTLWDGVWGQFFVLPSGRLEWVEAVGLYEIGEVYIKLDCRLFTDRMAYADPEEDEMFAGIRFPDGTDLEWSDYTAPSGLQARIAKVDRPDRFNDAYIAVFSLNGIPCMINADVDIGASASRLEEARVVLLQVLDGFVLPE